MGPQALETDFRGPLPDGTVGLLLGHSSKTMQVLMVHPAVIDSDYTGIVKVMISSPKGIAVIVLGEHIAQLLVSPSCHGHWHSHGAARGDKGFGSTRDALVNLSMSLQDRPLVMFVIGGVPFEGLLDTGADVSIIRQSDWPKQWPLKQSGQTLRGLGTTNQPQQCASVLSWTDAEGHKGSFQPYVRAILVTSWGREVLSGMGLCLSNEVYQRGSTQARNIMHSMGFDGKGLGKFEQGQLDSLPVRQQPGGTSRKDRSGFLPGATAK